MKIKVASLNPQKIQAVKDTVLDYQELKDALVEGVNVSSDVGHQPASLSKTIEGAINRARNAFIDCDYSFGIESGLIPVPETKSGFMDICICAIYDGDEFHLGLSSGFEIPKKVLNFIDEETDLSAAFKKAGLTTKEKIGTSEGVVGMLTRGRIDRLEQTKQSIITSLVHLENKNLF